MSALRQKRGTNTNKTNKTNDMTQPHSHLSSNREILRAHEQTRTPQDLLFENLEAKLEQFQVDLVSCLSLSERQGSQSLKQEILKGIQALEHDIKKCESDYQAALATLGVTETFQKKSIIVEEYLKLRDTFTAVNEPAIFFDIFLGITHFVNGKLQRSFNILALSDSAQNPNAEKIQGLTRFLLQAQFNKDPKRLVGILRDRVEILQNFNIEIPQFEDFIKFSLKIALFQPKMQLYLQTGFAFPRLGILRQKEGQEILYELEA